MFYSGLVTSTVYTQCNYQEGSEVVKMPQGRLAKNPIQGIVLAEIIKADLDSTKSYINEVA